MAQEKEIKIQLQIPLGVFVKRIQKRGYKLLDITNQNDIYFDTPDWYLYEHFAALRLRITNGEESSFSFKKVFYLSKKPGNYYIEKIEINIPFRQNNELRYIFKRLNIPYRGKVFKSGEEISNYLKSYSYNDDQKMTKTRKIYSDGNNEIVIDNIESVGVIVELECLTEEPLNVVKGILKEREWKRSFDGSGYMWLKNVKGLTSHITNLERFKIKPDWNVWNNERDMYTKLNEAYQ